MLHINSNEIRSDMDNIETVLTDMDRSKINMIPVIFISKENHISIVLTNPFTKTIEYYNTFPVGNISTFNYDKIHKHFHDYTKMPITNLPYQQPSVDLLCELWVCFITECRILNCYMSGNDFISNMINITTKIPYNFHWYIIIISIYFLYYEYEVIIQYIH